MSRTGRPKRGPIEAIRTKAWFAYVKERAGVSSAYAVAEIFKAKKDKHFEKYQRGTISPNDYSLKIVDGMWPGTRDVYEIGPLDGGINVPLWKALAGSIEEVWQVLVWLDPEIELLRFNGSPYFERIKRLMGQLSPFVPIKVVLEPSFLAMNNHVAKLCSQDMSIEDFALEGISLEGISRKYIQLDLRLLTAVIAMWRYSMFVGDGWREMDYIVHGLSLNGGEFDRVEFREDGSRRLMPIPSNPSPSLLLSPSPVRVILDPFGIADEVLDYLDRIKAENAMKFRAATAVVPFRRGMVLMPLGSQK